MFKKSKRLTTSEFSVYFKTGKRKHFTHLTVITAPLPKDHKVSVVVGKKVSKSAVRRNALRRRVYAVLKRYSETTALIGVVIVVLKPSFNGLPKKTAEEFLVSSIAEAANRA